MARQKTKATDPIRVWLKKLATGSQAIYLVYHKGGKRTYEHLGLYLIPEHTQADKSQNANTLLMVNTIKAQRIIELANGKAGVNQSKARGKMLLLDWMEHFKALKLKQGQSKSNAVCVNNLILHLKAYKGDNVKMQQVDKAYCEGFIQYLSTAKCFPRNKRQRKPVVHKAPKPLSATTITDYYNLFIYALNEAKRAKMPKSVLLLDWMMQFYDDKQAQGVSRGRLSAIKNISQKLQMYSGDAVRLKNIDEAFCSGFLDFLHTATCTPTRAKEKQYKEAVVTPLSKVTAQLYYNTFVCALNEAVKAEIIEANPTAKITKEAKKCIKPEGNTRTYLTLEELKALMVAKCPNEELKRAFFFACFCGLRISDIIKLTWAEVRQEGQQLIIDTTMKKTGKALVLPISRTAERWMPERGAVDGLVFANLPAQSTINDDIKVWAKRAGITKNVVFHTSRHTFATTALTLGADLYTTSKLLGHQNLRTTQIYAEIVNKKKAQAVNLFDGLQLEEK